VPSGTVGTMAKLKHGQITAAKFRKVYEALKAAEARHPKEHCPKCGRAVISMPMHSEAATDMVAAGYDGTCCWPGFDVAAKAYLCRTRKSKP